MKEKIKEILKQAGINKANLECNTTVEMLTDKIVNVVREKQNPSLKRAVDELNEKGIKPRPKPWID